MCCRVTIEPVSPNLHEVLHLAGFAPISRDFWDREIRQNDLLLSTVRAENKFTHVNLSLRPSIASHDLSHHVRHAAAGSIMFKVAMTLAEACGGTITQEGLMGQCLDANGDEKRLLAQYPTMPLTFDRLCLGFSEVLMRGVSQEQKADDLYVPR